MNKIIELQKMIGEQVSENFSPTLRAKLLEVDGDRGTCLMEVAENYYKDGVGAKYNHKVGTRYFAPIECIWNAFFF
jgi:hypothetical protein